jgi:hypothetical protein
MKFINALLALSFLAFSTPNHADSYDPVTNLLTINSIQVGNTLYSNVVVTVGSIISIGSATPVGCTASNITRTALNAITVGMSLEQVNQVIGCAYDPGASIGSANNTLTHSWYVSQPLMFIAVTFTNEMVTKTQSYGI